MMKKSCMRYLSRALSSIFCLGGVVDPRKIFGATQRREKFFRACRGVQGHAPMENFEKIVFRFG